MPRVARLISAYRIGRGSEAGRLCCGPASWPKRIKAPMVRLRRRMGTACRDRTPWESAEDWNRGQREPCAAM
ncbi:hypothetical protein BJQ90_01691 [Arthrobacter sp. SO3]|nr:hypothetical protein [Arthrobacter sp. SO3]